MADMTPLAEANTKFALDIYQQFLVLAPESNIFLSPFSITVALAMTHAGAKSSSEEEMKRVLHFTDIENVHDEFEKLHSVIMSENNNYALDVANRLFGRKEYKFLEEFLSLCEKKYTSPLHQLDFESDPNGSRLEINKWVEDKTNSKIKDLLADGTIDTLTALVLVNAIYFKGNWANKFDPSKTLELDFHPTSVKKVKAMFMTKKAKYGYFESEELDCQVLELSYVGNDLSMLMFLPNKRHDLKEMESKLTLENLKPVFNFKFMRRQTEVIVNIPKFKLEHSADLKEALVSLGMKTPFDDASADFSGMDGTMHLFLSKVVHKAFVDVNEEGTEAAAATAVVMRLKCMRIPKPPPEFIADHPFLFMIRDNRSQSILFMGKLLDPTQ